MATIGNSYVNLIDVYRQQDNNGDSVAVIEMLMEMNPILDDAMAIECNSGAKHLHTVRAGLPEVTWGMLYKGTPNSKSSVSQVEDTTGFVEGLAHIDVRLVNISKNAAAVRLGEANSYLEAMSQEVTEKIFYGNTITNPEEFLGLSPRFSEKAASNGGQIIDAGGTGSDLTSIWFVTWGDNQCSLLYPEGTQAGVKRDDKGEQRVTDAAGNAYYAFEEKFTWHVGLAVKDWRYVSRIANIDVSEVAAGNVKLFDFMRKAYYKLQNRRVAGGKIAIYLNRDMCEALDALSTNAGASDSFIRLTTTEIEGVEVQKYRGIPLRESDALLNTEDQVV